MTRRWAASNAESRPAPRHLRVLRLARLRAAHQGRRARAEPVWRHAVRRLPDRGHRPRLADVSVPALGRGRVADDNLLIERDGAVALVTFNRPGVLNAINAPTLDALRRAILDLQRDDSVRAVILTGSGDKAFVAGADINALAVQPPTIGREHAMIGQHVLGLIENMGKPVIAAINGYALGGGCELAMACTLRVVADTAKIGLP